MFESHITYSRYFFECHEFCVGLTSEHRPGMLMRLARLGAENSAEVWSIERDIFFHSEISKLGSGFNF